MMEPLSDVKIKDIEEELKINTVCPARFGAYLSSLIISHRLLQQRVTALEEESRQWEKENLVKLIKERDILKEENEHMSNLLIRFNIACQTSGGINDPSTA